MNDCGCEHCSEVCQTYKIDYPSDLKQAIKVIKDNIADGTIIESNYWPDQNLGMIIEPFAEIKTQGPWDDILIYYFECTQCKQLFKLGAETYHGQGGSWEPVKKGGL